MKQPLIAIFALFIALSFSGCSAEPGSKAWCDAIKEKPKSEWTADDLGTYAKHCVLNNYKK